MKSRVLDPTVPGRESKSLQIELTLWQKYCHSLRSNVEWKSATVVTTLNNKQIVKVKFVFSGLSQR